ncbi:MAG: HEPN domain-containing protein [Vallitalea sp.]|jgi:hypothetical protein|nr:HEPN domain-containing protein [Vallitalea sp.]
MDEYSVEYLLIFKENKQYSNSKQAIKNLFNSIYNVHGVSENIIEFEKIQIQYKILLTKRQKQKRIYYNISFIIEGERNIEVFSIFLRQFRELFGKLTDKHIETLWDDVNLYYSNKGYPYIYKLENLMRRLISEFMILNIGDKWVKNNIPGEVEKSIKDTNNKTNNYLHYVDFIQLGNFMFKKYCNKEYEYVKLIELIDKTDDNSELSIEELKKYVPKSNWERYFSSIIKCNENYLCKKWDSLYKLRCDIAHNKPFNKNNYQTLEKLYNEVSEVLKKAILSLDTIIINDKEEVRDICFGWIFDEDSLKRAQEEINNRILHPLPRSVELKLAKKRLERIKELMQMRQDLIRN